MSPTFQPVVTNVGLCQSWNNQNQNEVFKPSTFFGDFQVAFNDSIYESEILPASIKTKLVYFDKQEVYLQTCRGRQMAPANL